MKELVFIKYQGLGNDFIMVDNRSSPFPIVSSAQATKLCNRHFGIGADGVIFALPGQQECDYSMRIYNSDGSEPQMCGNGIRCLAKFIQSLEKKDTTKEVTYRIWTNAGQISPTINPDGMVKVDMGQPILSAQHIPTKLIANREVVLNIDGVATNVPVIVDVPVDLACTDIAYTTPVGMGNPHTVMFVDSLLDMEPPFTTIGPAMEGNLVAFPERVNAEFVEVLCRTHVRMQVWERGAGPTLACGTGACAVVVAGVLSGRTERHCTVTLPGGDLDIHWDAQNNRIYMTGPAEEVFSGIVTI